MDSGNSAFSSRIEESAMSTRRNSSYRPAVCLLEDRTVPTVFRPFTGGPATHLIVIAPQPVQAGQSFMVEVEAADAGNRVSTGFTGPVQIVLGTADASATLPAYTFTKADGGVHFFQVTLTLAGSQSIGARDTAAGATIAGGVIRTVMPGMATHFQVTAPTVAPVGMGTSVTVAAEDAYNNVATNFTGLVHLSAANSNLPANYTFVAGDHGKHAFNVTFTSAGSKTVSATAASNNAITGHASLLAYVSGEATHFSVIVLGPVSAGMPTLVQVVALDAGNQVASGYLGVVHFTSSDGFASLLNDYGFTSSDDGSHLFRVAFAGPGTETFTVTDTMTSSITGTGSVIVAPAMPPGYYGVPGYYGSGYYGWGWNNLGWGWY
jgi:hypothetical protein